MDRQRFAALCSAALLLVGAELFVNVARAEYRCSPPRSRIDEQACEKAKQGPDALRHFIQRMRPIEDLYFFDYVNEERLLAWRLKGYQFEVPLDDHHASTD